MEKKKYLQSGGSLTQPVKYCGLFREGGTVQCTNKWRVKLYRNIKLQESRVLYKREGLRMVLDT